MKRTELSKKTGLLGSGIGIVGFGMFGLTNGSLIGGTALSTTSLAVVYAVLVERGLTASDIGKLLMGATFVTDLLTALALSLIGTSVTDPERQHIFEIFASDMSYKPAQG